MKTFIIKYEHITGPRGTTCDNLLELSTEIDRIEADDYIIESTVTINTIEKP